MPRKYGLPYQGSKDRIADEIIAMMPRAEHFYDLFGGGGAITHAALLSGKFKHVHYNDIRPGLADAVRRAINGLPKEWRDQWISREEFHRLKRTDWLIALIWSFGNKGGDYLYAQELEPYKKAFHYAAVFEDYSLFEAMDVHPKRSTKPTVYERKLDIGNWLKANKDEVKAKYIAYWLQLVDEKKRHYEEIHGYVLRGEDLSLKLKDEQERLRAYLLDALKDSGLTQAEVGRRLNTQMEGHYFGRSQWAFPTYDAYRQMQAFMPKLTADYYELTRYYDIVSSLQSLEGLQSLESLQSLEGLQSLQRLQRLQRLQSLQSLQSKLTTSEGDYRAVEIPNGAVVYCDIPYKDTTEYMGAERFNHDEYYQWVESFDDTDTFIFTSSYEMP